MTRPFRPYLSLILLASLLIGLALAYLWLHLATPFDNGRLQPRSSSVTAAGLMVTPVKGGPIGFIAGDVVVAVDGHSLAEWQVAGGRWQVGDVVHYTVIREGIQEEISVTLDRYPLWMIVQMNWGTIVFALLYLPIALYVFLRRPDLPAAQTLFLSGAALFCATTWSLGAQVSDFVDELGLWLYYITIIPGFMLIWIASFHFALVFPQPLAILQRRWLLPLIYGLPYLLLVFYVETTRVEAVNRLDWMSRWGVAADVTAAVFLLLTLTAVSWQYHTNQSGITKLQMRWLVFAVLLVGGSALLFYFIPPMLGITALDSNLIGLIGVLFPLAIAIAILRHNLFDIDTLLNRALVYGGLTAVIITLYILSVSLLSTLFQTQGNLFIALITTGLVAVIFQPLRERLQRAVNRLMYGERDEPFEVLSQLGLRLESTLTADKVYPAIVETVAQTLKLPYAAVSIQRNGRFQTAESYGKPTPHLATYPLTHQGEIVGQLLVARRAADEEFTEADERILRNVARQAGTAVHAIQLMADLQQSRQQIITSREEERRRIRRDLHDGLGPVLASLALQADTARDLVRTDPDDVEEMLADITVQAKTAVEDIRRLVYDLRPPALDELGLLEAIKTHAAYIDPRKLQVLFDLPESLPMLPAAVEVATYRITQEAVNNVLHHAQATTCTIRLWLRDDLYLEIHDDGRGLPRQQRSGVGLTSMRERAAELNGRCTIAATPAGGTCVSAQLPLGD